MGGGDLNLKKSWHPSTLRNIERVWKAEQKHEVEKQKIEQLQKELAEERAREEIQAYAEDQGVVKKKEERLDWMYQGPAALINREDYLLGRKIDKTFEILQQQENGSEPAKDDGSDIGSTMFSSQNLSGTATVDLANKIREDPLFNIMKKEKEQRKNLLTNPVKMKQLQELLKASLTKKSKKSKKEKKRKHKDEDYDITKHQKTDKRHKSKYSNSSQSGDEKVYSDRLKYGKTSENSSMTHKMRHIDETSSYKKCIDSRCNKVHVSDLKERNSKHSSSYYKEYNYKESHQKKYESSNSRERDRTSKAENKRKMDEEERDRRLKEMQENAKWREEQRKKNTKRYREEDEKEDRIQRVHTSEFIKPMLSKVASKASLENRVKQKIFTIQRNYGDMDKNFVKRS